MPGALTAGRPAASRRRRPEEWRRVGRPLLAEYARTRELAVRNRLLAVYEAIPGATVKMLRLPPQVEMGDAIAAARLGLIWAIEHYDPQKAEAAGAAPETWLIFVTQRRLRGFLRTLGRWSAREQQADQDTPAAGSLAALDDFAAAEDRINHRQLLAVIDQLPDRERKILGRIYRDGWTKPEVAGELGVSVNWVNKVHREAVSRLRELLEDWGP